MLVPTQLVSFLSAHFAVLFELFVIASIIAAACDQLANLLAVPFPRAAHVFAGIAHTLPQILKFLARIISALLNRPFDVPGGTPQASPQTALPPNASQR